ncbi:MAG: type II toxin-antitoxin system VapC family toxin [Solirubrobacterales bacterium]|nr:type II toxin-antitoxin system VapC family toxin [Solirubrobacterales bacterium]
MAADTSALVAVVLGEPDAERFLTALRSDPVALCAVSFTEASIVVEARQGADAGRDLPLRFKGDDFTQTDLRAV